MPHTPVPVTVFILKDLIARQLIINIVMIRSMRQSECRQLLLCVRFIRGNRSMLAALQKKDWKAFARHYNGPAYAQNRYDEKLCNAYSSFCK